MKLTFTDTTNNITASSYRSPETYGKTLDDRQEKIEIIDGVCVDDCGYIEQGDVLTFTAVFTATEFQKVKSFFVNRTKITFTDETGTIYNNVRVILKSYKAYNAQFYPDMVSADFEIWMV